MLDAIRSRIDEATPQGLLLAGFGSLILLGTLLLWLPLCHMPGKVGLLTALFTATSAVCVTGLVVVDTGTDFTPVGQGIILLLIQTGGLGIMTFAALGFQLLGRRLSLSSQAALHDALFQKDMAGQLRHLLRDILRMTGILELAGALLLFLALLPGRPAGAAAFSALFHSISAFCNAGFSLHGDSLVGLRESPLLVTSIMALIVLGGLGHPVLLELWRAARVALGLEPRSGPRLLSLHAHTVLWTSLLLLAAGTLGLLVFGLTPGERTAGAAASGALFQSVTARTAGFNTVDIGALPAASALLLIVLMFIGGSPGSCAGGIKTTTLALWVARLRGSLHGESDVHLAGRHIPRDTVRRSSMLVALALCWNLAGTLLLLSGEAHTRMAEVLFEQVSAFGTVGLSMGLTPRLGVAGRLWTIVTMYLGRVGPLTLTMWAIRRVGPTVRYPEGRIMIG